MSAVLVSVTTAVRDTTIDGPKSISDNLGADGKIVVFKRNMMETLGLMLDEDSEV